MPAWPNWQRRLTQNKYTVKVRLLNWPPNTRDYKRKGRAAAFQADERGVRLSNLAPFQTQPSRWVFRIWRQRGIRLLDSI